MALLSMTCKSMYVTVIDFYDESKRSLGNQRRRRVCVSDCLHSFTLRKFYVNSVQSIILGLDFNQPSMYASVFGCDKGECLWRYLNRMSDLTEKRATLWSVSTGPVLDSLESLEECSDVASLKRTIRPDPWDAEYKRFKYHSDLFNYLAFYVDWYKNSPFRLRCYRVARCVWEHRRQQNPVYTGNVCDLLSVA
ncbi:hypothetical protein CYMTET_35616 [Cymbomonas tetramitiformis]|uniref:Uncharacterized protein n=1 Tax=Cymbomonas tetramitiformis TaxID=36881 RepID=A0AAE0F8Q0_9CHLO|nr:hypothetical protein CYMTET_35616 [Cymbomonas tetramitiformis]